jgi:hypothetical protein
MAKITPIEQSQQNERQDEDELGIPLMRPSERDQIPEEEQIRLIKETGIFDRLPPEKEEELSPLADSIREFVLLVRF